MISNAIIVAGICAVVCVVINAVKAFALDKTRRLHKIAAFSLCVAIQEFVSKFNETYGNTRIVFRVEEDGTPVLDFEDVEPENTEK